MGLVLWIDENTFASSLLEKVFKKEELPFYTLNSAADFSYLVDDLKPVLLVLDGETATKYADQLRAQYESSENLRSLPVVWVGSSASGLDFISKTLGVIERPFDPFEIPSLLKKMTNLN